MNSPRLKQLGMFLIMMLVQLLWQNGISADRICLGRIGDPGTHSELLLLITASAATFCRRKFSDCKRASSLWKILKIPGCGRAFGTGNSIPHACESEMATAGAPHFDSSTSAQRGTRLSHVDSSLSESAVLAVDLCENAQVEPSSKLLRLHGVEQELLGVSDKLRREADLSGAK